MPAARHTFTKAEAKNLIIHSQGLNVNLSPCDVIRQLSYVQIDTLAVATRAHHHVLHSRSSDYAQTDLNEMMREKQVYEYWSHAASYLPMEDYRFSLVRKKEYAKGQNHWFEQNKKLNRYVLDRIKVEGPLQSKDFKETRDVPSAWYDWKPAKIALEQLFMEGKLMVKERRNFQKVYDLAERVLPVNIDTGIQTNQEYCHHLIKSTLKAQGIATLNEIAYLRKGIKTELVKSINKLIKLGEVQRVDIEGLDQEYFMLMDTMVEKPPNAVHILSPFDNLVIQRKRLLNLFDFDYQIECYVPEAKRKYGYYCLPVLYSNRFVARFDPKADRKTKIFTIKAIWFEPNFTPDDEFYAKFSDKLKRFAVFCGCDKIVVKQCSPASCKKELIKATKAS